MLRRPFFILLFAVFGLVLLLRLVDLQIFHHRELLAAADASSLRVVTLTEPARGAILDREGRPLTAAEDSAALLVVPALLDDADVVCRRLAETLELDGDKLKSAALSESEGGETFYREAFIAEDALSESEIEAVAASSLRGVFVIEHRGRLRPERTAQHLIGSLEEERDSRGETSLKGGSGLEALYDAVLKGERHRVLRFPVDAKGRAGDFDGYYLSEDVSGDPGSLRLSLDLDVQRLAESALGGRDGAVVILDSISGDVLALASSPKFDPRHLAEEDEGDIYVNKVFAAAAPASLFKVLTAAEALEKGIVKADTLFHCGGGCRLADGRVVSCREGRGHGLLRFDEALAASCNGVFVQTALKLGKSELREAFQRWELDDDRLTGYPLKARSRLEIDDGEGALANAALGEEGVALTPLNAAKMLNVVACGGLLLTPRLVTAVEDGEGREIRAFDNALPKRVISSKTAATLTEMMKKTFLTGTAASLNLGAFDPAGKTGSSESGVAWIGAFFPADHPRYTVVVMVRGGSGAADGGPVLKTICSGLLRDEEEQR